jgi:hypothetical protein
MNAYLRYKQVEVSVIRVQVRCMNEQSVFSITPLHLVTTTYLQYPTRKSDQSAHNKYAHTP